MVINFLLLFSITIIFLTVVRIFGIPYTGIEGQYQKENSRILKEISFLADYKKDRFLSWLDERKNTLRILFKNQYIENTIYDIIQDLGKYKYLKSDDDISRYKKGSHYTELNKYIEDCVVSSKFYQNISIADVQTGTIIASSEANNVGEKINNYAYLSYTLMAGLDEIVTVEKDTLINRSEMIITRLLKGKDKQDIESIPLAVLVLRIDIDDFIKPILYQGDMSIDEYEIILINQDRVILSKLKYPLADSTIAKVMEYKLETKPAQYSTLGQEGIIIGDDYREKKILTAYRYLKVNPDIGWGLLIKYDHAEIVKSIRKEIHVSIHLAIFGFAVFIIVVIIIANRITLPIKKLTRIAMEVEKGNLNVKSEITSQDEVGYLVQIFNSMIGKIKSWHTELEEDVKLRTHQLNVANKDLLAEIEIKNKKEIELIKARQEWETIFQSSGHLTMIINTDNTILAANHATEIALNMPASELIGQKCCKIFHGTENPPENCPMHKMYQSQKCQTQEMEVKALNGWYIISCTPMLDENGEIEKIIHIATDVTDQKRTAEALKISEKYNRTLFDKSPIGLALTKMDGTIVDANQAYADIIGRTIEETLSLTYWDITPKKYDVIEQKQLNSLKSSGHYGPYEKEYIHKDGHLVPVRLNGLIINRYGEDFIWSSVEDITLRKTTEMELDKSLNNLRNLANRLESIREEERTTISREIHDELGQALTVLKIDLTWLEKNILPDSEILKSRCRSMINLTESIMKSVQKISSELRPGILDDLGLTAAIDWQIREFENRTGIKCNIIKLDEIENLDRRKATMIFRIFQETLTNIIRHSGASEVDIILITENSDLILEVSDNGIGIDETMIESSSSIGLLGMRERVHSYGGEIEIKGIKGKGTRVTFKIPF